jgi:hypothetical protein
VYQQRIVRKKKEIILYDLICGVIINLSRAEVGDECEIKKAVV